MKNHFGVIINSNMNFEEQHGIAATNGNQIIPMIRRNII